MLRRLLTALLAASIAVPLSAYAAGGCQMDVPMLAAERCDCCTGPMAEGSASCATPAAAAQAGCGCALRADTGSQPASAASVTPPSVSFSIEHTLIPAAFSTPQRSQRIVALAASPPGAGALVSRPALCSWTI